MTWSSTTNTSPFIRFKHEKVPYYRTDYQKIADDWEDLTDGNINIDIDEDGIRHENERVWTNTLSTGKHYAINPDYTCSNWTNGTPNVIGCSFYGITQNLNGGWTDSGFCTKCDSTLRLYCVQQ